jgi:3-phenylpropionate/cinnamic acid dioxygenase small subunit
MPPMTLEEISDRIEIQDLLTRYTVAIDEKDWEKLDTCFLSDAKVDYTTSGGIKGVYPDVRAWLEKALAPFTMTQHLISNTTVTIEGDRATSRTYVYNPMGIPKKDGSLHIFTVGAYYNDVLARTADGWRIAERFEEQAFMEGSLPGDFEIPS